MITTFRNLEISNQLLELNITDDVFKDAKKVFKKDRNLKASNNFYYYILKPTYKIGVYLGPPDYSHEDDKIVELSERKGKDTDDATWYQVNDTRLSFIPSTDEISKINYLHSTLRMYSQKTLIFENTGNYKKNIINSLRAEDKQNNYFYASIDTHIGDNSEDLTELVETINWLYDVDFNMAGLTDKQLSNLASKHSKFEWELGLYYKVKDLPGNRRLALIAMLGDRYYRGGYNYHRNQYRSYNSLSWKIIDVPHDNPAYNYIDEGTYGSNFSLQVPGSIQFDNTVISLPKTIDPIEHIIGRRKDPVHIFDQNAIDKANKKYMLKVAMDKDNENVKEALKLKINTRIKNIDKQPLKLNGAIFSNDQIEYSGQILRSKQIEIQNLLTKLYRYHDLDDINYDRAFEMFITSLIGEVMYIHNTDITAKIGDIDVTLYQKTGQNKIGSPYAVYYINKIRVNKDEFEPILQRAACFEDITTYNEFLKQVSACSLKIHGLLDRGIDITVRNPLKSERIVLKLELVRKNKRQHLKIGKDLFLIKNTARIVNLPKKDFLDDVIDVLLNPDNVENVTPANLKTLVIQARQAYTDAIEKAKQLLETTIEKFHLEKITVDVKNSRHVGYVVPGKIKTYFIAYNHDKHTNGCGVYTYPDMNYVCIVDKTPNQQVGVDKFVNRIYALANDQLLAKQIYTLDIQNK
jgi:hypothetical protein